MTLCGLGDQPRVIAPDGNVTTLLPDPAAGASRCAAYWPQHSGWHQLLQTDAVLEGNTESEQSAWPFFVYARDTAPGLHAAELREATLQRVGASRDTVPGPETDKPPGRRGPSWPWFLAWLASAALLWWLERARRGRGSIAS
jgi:hypothetical protein